MWHDGFYCGLWDWNIRNASSVTNANIGARLIIWDLMCLGHFLIRLELLSAVLGTMILGLACGYGRLM